MGCPSGCPCMVRGVGHGCRRAPDTGVLRVFRPFVRRQVSKGCVLLLCFLVGCGIVAWRFGAGRHLSSGAFRSSCVDRNVSWSCFYGLSRKLYCLCSVLPLLLVYSAPPGWSSLLGSPLAHVSHGYGSHQAVQYLPGSASLCRRRTVYPPRGGSRLSGRLWLLPGRPW